MSGSSTIEWTDATLNIVTGCDRVSEGCDHCYIERTPPLRISRRRFDEAGKMGVQLHPERLEWLFDRPDWRAGRRIFTPSLGDLFHQAVPDAFIAEALAAFAMCQHHTFQILTKRPQRMAGLLNDPDFIGAVECAVLERLGPDHPRMDWWIPRFWAAGDPMPWPPPNLHFGVSVELAKYLWRIRYLLQARAAVRFVSAEPLLGSLMPEFAAFHLSQPTRIDWVIVGGESGPGARPMAKSWVREIRDACIELDVPFFFKQWGEWAPAVAGAALPLKPGVKSFTVRYSGQGSWVRVGKKVAGRVLDGRTWDEFPREREPSCR